MPTTTWRALFENEHIGSGDETEVEFVAPNQSVLDVEFNNGWGGSEGIPFLIWTGARVYFPVVYDGAEWVGSAPRNPQDDGQRHVGGE